MSPWPRAARLMTIDGGRRAWLLLAVFALSWTLLEGVVGAQFQRPYPLLEIVFCRYAVHLLGVWMIWGRHDAARMWRTQRPVFHALRSLCMLVMPLGFAMALYGGMQMHTIWSLFWVSPLLILVLARFWLRETVPLGAWLAALLGSAAAVLLLGLHAPGQLRVVLWPLAMAAAFAVYIAMTRRLRHEAVQANLFHTAAGVFLLLAPVMPWFWVTPTLHDSVVLVGIGGVGLFGLWALDRACEAAPVSVAAPVLYLHLAGMFAIEAMGTGAHVVARQGLALSLVMLVAGIAWWMAVHGAPGQSNQERH